MGASRPATLAQRGKPGGSEAVLLGDRRRSGGRRGEWGGARVRFGHAGVQVEGALQVGCLSSRQ